MTEIGMRLCHARLEPNRLVVRRDRIIELPVVVKAAAEAKMCRGQVRFEDDCLAGRRDGLRELSIFAQHTTEIAVVGWILAIFLYGVADQCDGDIAATNLAGKNAEHAQGIGVVGVGYKYPSITGLGFG
jgi:hypothetical protein